MSNEELLNKRWEKTDKTLKSYLNNFKDINSEIVDLITEIFDTLDIKYTDINKPISKKEQKRLNRKISEWKDLGIYKGYFKYLIESKKEIIYAKLIEILLYSVYAIENIKIYDTSKKVFTEVATDIYSQAINEISKKPKKKFSLTWEIIWALLWIPIYEMNFDEYLELMILNNQQEMYKLVIAIIMQDKDITEDLIKDLADKQRKRLLNINDGKYSGLISDLSRSLGNSIYIYPFKENKDLQVRFIAEMDEKTTEMCRSLNNQLFYVNDWNRFQRYSDSDKKNVPYTIFGLELGINLPPIANHFHWCRSTITYLIENEEVINLARNKNKERRDIKNK